MKALRRALRIQISSPLDSRLLRAIARVLVFLICVVVLPASCARQSRPSWWTCGDPAVSTDPFDRDFGDLENMRDYVNKIDSLTALPPLRHCYNIAIDAGPNGPRGEFKITQTRNGVALYLHSMACAEKHRNSMIVVIHRPPGLLACQGRTLMALFAHRAGLDPPDTLFAPQSGYYICDWEFDDDKREEILSRRARNTRVNPEKSFREAMTEGGKAIIVEDRVR